MTMSTTSFLAQAGKLKIEVYTNTDFKGKGLGLKVKLKDNREHYLHLILSENTIKINNLDRHQLNFELKEHMILLYHADKPGVVGLVGSMLGACSINIIDMNLDNSLSPKESALMLITLDSKVDDEFSQSFEQIRQYLRSILYQSSLLCLYGFIL